MVQLTDTQFMLIVLAGLLIICIAGIGVYYISKKYPSKKGKLDPIFKAFYVWFLLVIGYVIIFLIGLRDRNEARGDLKWLIIALVVLVLFYAMVSLFVNRPIPSYKLWREYVLPDVKKFWNAEPYVGSAYVTGMLMHKVLEIGRVPEVEKTLLEMGSRPSNKVDVFYGQAIFSNVFPFLAVRNKYTGEDIMLVRPPVLTVALVQRFLGEEIVSSFTNVLGAYDTEESHNQPQQQVLVERT